MKGSLVAAYNQGNVVWLWFRSPTGDESDSHRFQMTCHDEAQAMVIAESHRNAWGIPEYGQEYADIYQGYGE